MTTTTLAVAASDDDFLLPIKISPRMTRSSSSNVAPHYSTRQQNQATNKCCKYIKATRHQGCPFSSVRHVRNMLYACQLLAKLWLVLAMLLLQAEEIQQKFCIKLGMCRSAAWLSARRVVCPCHGETVKCDGVHCSIFSGYATAHIDGSFVLSKDRQTDGRLVVVVIVPPIWHPASQLLWLSLFALVSFLLLHFPFWSTLIFWFGKIHFEFEVGSMRWSCSWSWSWSAGV